MKLSSKPKYDARMFCFDPAVIGLARFDDVRIDFAVARRYAIVGRALKDRQLLRLLRDDRDGLHRRCARADHGNAFGGEVDARVRPAAGVITLAAKGFAARDVRHVRRRQTADGADHVLRRNDCAGVRAHAPALHRVIVRRSGNARCEADTLAQVEAVGDVIEVTQNLRLLGIALGPLPLLQQLVVEGVTINITVRIAARAGVAVPIPRPAHAVARLVYAHAQSEFVAQAVERVHPGETRTDYDRVEFAGRIRSGIGTRCCSIRHRRPPVRAAPGPALIAPAPIAICDKSSISGGRRPASYGPGFRRRPGRRGGSELFCQASDARCGPDARSGGGAGRAGVSPGP